MSISFASFKQLNLPISIKIPVTIVVNCLYLHDMLYDDSYITKFDFMNYAFAKLVLAWLYHFEYLLMEYLLIWTCEFFVCSCRPLNIS